jgi:hypothetical protein
VNRLAEQTANSARPEMEVVANSGLPAIPVCGTTKKNMVSDGNRTFPSTAMGIRTVSRNWYFRCSQDSFTKGSVRPPPACSLPDVVVLATALIALLLPVPCG